MNFKPLTPDEVKRAYAFARQEAQPGSLLVYLLADLDRLRAVIKEAEKSGDRPGAYPMCPWCQSEPGDKDRHAECPAFTPEGVVR